MAFEAEKEIEIQDDVVLVLTLKWMILQRYCLIVELGMSTSDLLLKRFLNRYMC
jgi:hypothetical protein